MATAAAAALTPAAVADDGAVLDALETLEALLDAKAALGADVKQVRASSGLAAVLNRHTRHTVVFCAPSPLLPLPLLPCHAALCVTID